MSTTLTDGFRATIAMTRYREPDALVRDVIAAAAGQVGVTGEVLFLEQKSVARIAAEDCSKENWTVRQVACPENGLSFARNLAIEMAKHDTVLFLDADALAEPGWALALCKALADPTVAVAGSRIEPGWTGSEPLFARSRVVRDQYSLLDLGRGTMDVRRVIGASLGLRRDACAGEMYFDEDLDRRDGRLLSGGDTDLCLRVGRAGGRVVYVGDTAVRHVIPAERERLPWVLKRLFYTGLARATLGGTPSPSHRPGLADWLLLPLILPPYAAGWVWARLSSMATAGGAGAVNRSDHRCL